MNDLFQPVLDTIAQYPQWAGVLIFLIALFETIVGIGYILPGTWLMLSYGFLVGSGAIRFDVAMIALTTGGIIGDAIGYWIGRRYGRRVFELRFFRARQSLIAKSENFFARHGGKAVFLARMLGPIRPLVPFFAGLARMNLTKFTLCNIASAIIAAFVHLLPGMAIGLGLQFTGAMTWRIVILLVIITLIVWLCYEGARRGVRFAGTTGPVLAERLNGWAQAPERSRSAFGRTVAGALLYFVDPKYRATLAMASLGAVALACFTGMSVLLAGVIDGEPISQVNIAVFNFLDGLRTGWADHVMATLMALGGATVLVPLIVAVLAILLMRRDWLIAGYWGLTAAFAYATALVLEQVVPVSSAAAASGANRDAFPSGHAAISVIVLVYLAILCLPALSARRWRFAILFATCLLVGLISFAQLYFGVLVISGLAGGLLLGIGWLAVLTVVTRRHIPNAYPRWGRALGLVALAVLVTAGSASAVFREEDQLSKYSDPGIQTLVPQGDWREAAWLELPAYRIDFVGEPEEPLNVQIAGDLNEFRDLVGDAGWRRAPGWGLVETVAFVTGADWSGYEGRPVLPRFWNGHREALVLVKPNEDGRLVLRLWDGGYRVTPGGEPLYLGTVEREVERKALIFGSIHLPPRGGDFAAAAEILASDAGDGSLRSRGASWRPAAERKAVSWDGTTAVIAP